MNWTVFFVLSLVCLLASVVWSIVRAVSRNKGSRIFSTTRILLVGVLISAVILFIPVYDSVFDNTDCGLFETILISIHNVIRLVVVDGEFDFVTSNLQGLSPMLYREYSALFSILFVMAPVLTFGFVLSFFKGVSDFNAFLAHSRTDAFVFSELNERSLALAAGIKQSRKKCFLIFTDVFESNEEKSYELAERADELGAVCLKMDISKVRFSLQSGHASISFFLIGSDESENISQALGIIKKYLYRPKTSMYVFSTQMESELLLASTFNKAAEEQEKGARSVELRARRIDCNHLLVAEDLYENGAELLFENAYPDASGEKQINAVVVGMGQLGTEMAKSLTWLCQMDGYLPRIDAFDADPLAEDKFRSACPELMKFSGITDVPGESRYTICIHSGMNAETNSFDETLADLPQATYVFIALGSDEKNIAMAVKLRTLYERLGYAPRIQTVVYHSDKREALKNIVNFKGEKYAIDFIGDMKAVYSEKVILSSVLEQEALARHLKWGKEQDFWQYSYNYKSSIAAAIHHRMKIRCGIPGAEKTPAERSEAERWSRRVLEHRRWNAYMRSEGYVYGGTTEPKGRNDLAKMHNCLVPFSQLPPKEQKKDDD